MHTALLRPGAAAYPAAASPAVADAVIQLSDRRAEDVEDRLAQFVTYCAPPTDDKDFRVSIQVFCHKSPLAAPLWVSSNCKLLLV
jgi:hypothetical protein